MQPLTRAEDSNAMAGFDRSAMLTVSTKAPNGGDGDSDGNGILGSGRRRPKSPRKFPRLCSLSMSWDVGFELDESDGKTKMTAR